MSEPLNEMLVRVQIPVNQDGARSEKQTSEINEYVRHACMVWSEWELVAMMSVW